MGFGELMLLAVGVSMDAFAVSICKGLAMKKATLKAGLTCGVWFGGFQALMPTIGFFLGTLFAEAIHAIDHWVAFILLAVIGAVTAWAIQDGMYKTHIRGKIPVYVAMACVVIWVVLGIVAGIWLIGLITVAGQLLAGMSAAYGGRRSELGRFNANEILGIRHYLKHISQEDLDRMVDHNPDYFFDMLPYAIALGVDTPFAKAFGDRQVPHCSYLQIRQNDKRTAKEWAYLVRKLADRMDDRQRKMELEKWIPLSLAAGFAPAPQRRPQPQTRRRR